MEDTMTLHRGLAELKLADSKIQKAIGTIEPTGLMQKGRKVNNLIEKEEFEKKVEAQMQSITDLINRKRKIKSAIVKANGTTTVKIGDNEMTIADAIHFKSIVDAKKNLLETLRQRYQQTVGAFNVQNEKAKEIANQNAEAMFASAPGEQKSKETQEAVEIMIQAFIERNEVHMVDPLKVEKLIETLEEEIGVFETEIDATLSEINAVTKIEI